MDFIKNTWKLIVGICAGLATILGLWWDLQARFDHTIDVAITKQTATIISIYSNDLRTRIIVNDETLQMYTDKGETPPSHLRIENRLLKELMGDLKKWEDK